MEHVIKPHPQSTPSQPHTQSPHERSYPHTHSAAPNYRPDNMAGHWGSIKGRPPQWLVFTKFCRFEVWLSPSNSHLLYTNEADAWLWIKERFVFGRNFGVVPEIIKTSFPSTSFFKGSVCKLYLGSLSDSGFHIYDAVRWASLKTRRCKMAAT